MKKDSIKSEDYEKYYKQLILKKIGVAGQKKILKSKVLVVGAGGLGCPLILYLAYSGVGNIGIVDNDKVELSNLSRQILFTKKDIGKYKTSVSRNMIKKINNKINGQPSPPAPITKTFEFIIFFLSNNSNFFKN